MAVRELLLEFAGEAVVVGLVKIHHDGHRVYPWGCKTKRSVVLLTAAANDAIRQDPARERR